MAPQVFQQPQPLSVNDHLRQHSRDSPYRHPLHWTNQQPKLLNCRFVRRQCMPRPARPTRGSLIPLTESGKPREDSKADLPKHGLDIDLEEAVRQLAYCKDIIAKRWGLIDLLEAFSKDRIVSSQDDLEFYFAGRPVAKLPSHIFCYVINDVRTPFLAYIDSSEIASFRENSIPIPQCNLPAWRIRKATLAQLQPSSVEQDPYLVSVLIAQAQARQYAHSNDATACQSSYTVHLLLTNRDKPGFVRLYTATITTAFLRKLDQPSIFSDSSLIIRCARIPSISCLKHEIAAIAEPPKGKKRPRESSLTTEQGPSKQNKKLGN